MSVFFFDEESEIIFEIIYKCFQLNRRTPSEHRFLHFLWLHIWSTHMVYLSSPYGNLQFCTSFRVASVSLSGVGVPEAAKIVQTPESPFISGETFKMYCIL